MVLQEQTSTGKHLVLGAIAALSLTSSAAFAQERAAQTATDHAGVVGHWAITWFAPVYFRYF